MVVECPLIIQDLTLPPASEWSPKYHGWTVARIAEGSGYCLCQKNAADLQVGDGFMAPQTTPITMRASQLGPLRLQYFQIQPELLNGLLTVAECQQLKALSDHSAYIRIFKANDLIGQKFSQLIDLSETEKLAARCALLQLWADGVADSLDKPSVAGPSNKKLRERFCQLMQQLPEAELLELSLTEIARQLHCSERHFRYLFRQEFGVPFRSHRIELRLQHARHLLTDSSIKIASIAYESGYQHLALFNATFKRRFGMTPSEWRRRNSPSNPSARLQNFHRTNPPPS